MNDADMRNEFRSIRVAVEELTQGLILVGGTLGDHTKMLSAIMEAITKEPDGPSPLEELLEKILHTLDSQTATLETLNSTMGDALERLSGTGNVTPSVLLSEQNINNNNNARTTSGSD